MPRVAIYHDTQPFIFVQFEDKVEEFMRKSFERDAVEVSEQDATELRWLTAVRRDAAKRIREITDRL